MRMLVRLGVVAALLAATAIASGFVRVERPPGGAREASSLAWLEAASVFNAAAYNVSGSADNAPRCGDVYYCNDAAGVVAAASDAFARGALRLQARSGRHSYLAAAAVTPGAAVIDVSNLSSVRVDSQPRVACDTTPAATATRGEGSCTAVWVGPGAGLFDVYSELDALGLFFPGGTCPTVAVGGFTLGGGYGMWSRTLGLAVDNVIAIEIAVLKEPSRPSAGLQLVTVNATHDAALFRALLGGGNNNFGVVTAFLLRAFPKPAVVSQWRLNVAAPDVCSADVLPLFDRSVRHDWAHALNWQFHAPPGAQPLSFTLDVYRSGCAVIVVGVNVTSGALEGALSGYGWLAVPGVSPSPGSPQQDNWLEGVAKTQGCANATACRALVRRLIPNPAAPSRWVALSSYQDAELRVARSKQFVQAMAAAPKDEGTFPVAIIDAYGGAINASGLDDATAFIHHTAHTQFQVMAYLDSGNATRLDAATGWALTVLAVLDEAAADAGARPHSYQNYPSLALPNANSRYFGPQLLPVLESLKRVLDPFGVFSSQQSIQPL